MTTLPYWHVDAFANRPFAGNQAAVMPLASWLSDATLQAIAEENNFAETAFVVRDTSGGAGQPLRKRKRRQRFGDLPHPQGGLARSAAGRIGL